MEPVPEPAPTVVDEVATETTSETASHSESKEPPKLLDLVFCMDCTGSMGSYIEAGKASIQSIVQKLIAFEKCDLRFGLVAYRDHPPQDSTYVTQVFEFVSSMRRMQSYLDGLSAQGGGDGPEAVATGLYDCLHMPWRKDATKVVILISDAPPHGLGENGDGFPDGEPNGHDPIAIANEMAAQNIVVYSVGCEPAIQSYKFARAFLCSIAEITGGQALALSNAAVLADVILGGAIEELGLTRLMETIQQEVRDFTAEKESRGEAYGEEDVARYVTTQMNSRNVKTKQMKSNVAMVDSNSAFLKSARTLASAKESLAPVAASYGAPRPGARRAADAPPRSGFLASISSALFGAPSSAASAPPGDHSELEAEDDLDDEYVASSFAAPSPLGPPAAAPRPATEEVAVSEEDFSYDQALRMVSRITKSST